MAWSRPTAGAPDDQEDDDQQDDRPERKPACLTPGPLTRDPDPFERDAAPLRDPSGDAFGAREKSRAVLPLAEQRRHELADRFAGEAVGDPLLELVPDLDFDLPLLDRDDDQQAVVPAAFADAAPVVLEQLDGILLDVRKRLDRRNGRDDDDVPGGCLQRAADAIDFGRVLRVEDVGEVVDRLRELGEIVGLRDDRCRKDQRRTNR